jgi:hypothetical protein
MVCGFVIKRLDVPAAKRLKLRENVPRGLGKGPTWPTNSNLCARTTQHARIQRFVHVHSKRRKRESGSEAGLDSIRPTVCCRPKCTHPVTMHHDRFEISWTIHVFSLHFPRYQKGAAFMHFGILPATHFCRCSDRMWREGVRSTKSESAHDIELIAHKLMQ